MENLDPKDRTMLRDLARRVAEIATWAIMAERRELWRRHNAMEAVRPVVYVDNCWSELLPENSLACRGKEARAIESGLRRRIYGAEHFASDNVVEREWIVQKDVHDSDWGLTPRRSYTDKTCGFQPVILAPSDFAKLRFPEVTYDVAATRERLDFSRSLFGDILEIRLKGINPTYHLMNQYSAFRGLQELLVDMIENPRMVHDAMAFLEEGHRRILKQWVEQDLLSLNNDNTPLYTSGHGYTDQLPRPGHKSASVRPEDLWGWAEAQEMAVVSPEMHAEFAFPYEKRLLEPFGLNGYGCCDDVTNKLDFVLTIPRLRRVSVSAWADVDRCAERIGGAAIFMWKPNPAHLVGDFNPEKIRSYVAHTVEQTRACHCVLEIALMDVATCENHPERIDRWTRIVHEAVTQ